MRVRVVFNPIAGAGQSAVESRRIVAALRDAGHDASERPSEQGDGAAWLDPLLADTTLLVVVGGDGAVRGACAAASRCSVPLYQFPCGTENLFAREMGMDRSLATLLRSIERGRVDRVDLGEADGEPFVLMASLGFDARVVADLARSRDGSITRWSYARPLLRQLGRWQGGRMTVRVDGERIDGDQPGFVVVANCRQYGWRLNPANRATMRDGLLDAVFFPCASRVQLVHWMVKCRLQRHLDGGRAVYRTGAKVQIEPEHAEPMQVDGDPFPGPVVRPCRPSRVEIAVRPSALPVLMPAPERR